MAQVGMECWFRWFEATGRLQRVQLPVSFRWQGLRLHADSKEMFQERLRLPHYQGQEPFLFLVAMPGGPSSVLAPSSKARSP